MKIAVTYDNGTIFQHFGKTETFKVYEKTIRLFQARSLNLTAAVTVL